MLKNGFTQGAAVLAVIVAAIPGAPALSAASAALDFGFTGPEVFPIQSQIGNLRSADIDGDGLNDLVVVNNLRSRITLLYNQSGTEKMTDALYSRGELEVNELPPDARFRIESISSEKRIASLELTDLNGDKRPDIAYFGGDPKELVLQYNEGKEGWSAAKRWPLKSAPLNPNGLTHGDLNGDQREDLVLIGENVCHVWFQNKDRQLEAPVRIPFSRQVKAVQILDVNGDGRQDMLLVNWDSSNPFRFRLQGEQGRLGPEIHFAQPPVRSYWADDLDGDNRCEVMTIAAHSGRAQISHFARKPAEELAGGLKQGQFSVTPLKRTGKPARGSAWADLNGDGADDLLVAEPDNGEISLYLREADGEFAPPRAFPSMTGIAQIEVADWDGDGKAEIFLLSGEERQLGVTGLDANGRIAFPRSLPLEGRPIVFAVGGRKPDDEPELSVIVDRENRKELVSLKADGSSAAQELNKEFRSNPSAMLAHDIDQDGGMDLVVLIPYQKIKLLRSRKSGGFDELDIAPPGGSIEQPWASAMDVDGDGKAELLLAQKSFVRAVTLEKSASKSRGEAPSWSFRVKDQINGADGRSRIVGASPIRPGKGESPFLVLLDADQKALSLCERDEAGVWQIARNLPLPVFEFNRLDAVALGGKSASAISLQGVNSVATLRFAGDVWTIEELDSYETPIKDGFLMDVVTGDLNRDKVKDLVFLESSKNHLDIVKYTRPRKLAPGNRWKVFEQRTFRGGRGGGPEPREALVRDLTGDGRNDLAIIVHDRVLLYPQE